MKLAIVGAGPAGLVAAKYSLQHGHECDVFEQTGAFGGMWIYTDEIGTDKDGIPIHTSMYKGLITNFPKELMTYPDCPYPGDQTKSYITQEEVLDYLHIYASKFNIKERIQFYKRVIDITPENDGKWRIRIEDAKSKLRDESIYDAVLICNGRFCNPKFPTIKGQELIRVPQTHSHCFRTPDPFKLQTVLIVGGSYSGQELCFRIAGWAKRVILSHRAPQIFIPLPKNVTEKPEVSEFMADSARFVDRSVESFDCVLYCTGFEYSGPFVSKECGLSTANNWVRPLYKQIVNVEYPTMHFIGLPYIACGIPLFDYQAQFSMAVLDKRIQLPSKEEMMDELDNYMAARRERGIPDGEAHKLGSAEAQEEYLQQLSAISGIPPIRPVVNKLYSYIKSRVTFGWCFRVDDDENFTIVSSTPFNMSLITN